MKQSIFLFCLTISSCFLSNPLSAQQGDKWGNWLMYFGTNRIADDWSIHTEVQYRNHTVEPTNAEQLLLRTGINYHISKTAIVTGGYGFIPSYDFDTDQKAPESKEHRIFQQLILINKISRLKFEHRYRIEQRWVNSKYKNRLRYRLMAFLPINKPTISKGAFFAAAYNEVFMNTKDTFFDRNRLYGAIGYQFNKTMQAQIGYLYQRVNDFGKDYLQVGFVFNPDFRKKE